MPTEKDLTTIGTEWEADTEPHVRVLQCWDCKTMEELPDYHGNPEFDSVLQALDEKHGGQTEQPHYRVLHHIQLKFWNDRTFRRQFVKDIWKGTTGFVPRYYEIRNTLMEDATKCFIAHRRQIPCIDYRDSSKRLGNPAAQDRARLAREFHNDDLKLSSVRVFLCSYCPVQSKVDDMKYDEAIRRGQVS